MTANTGKFNSFTAAEIVGGWSPVTPVANYRRVAADYHDFHVEYVELRDYAAAGAVSNGDTYTWTLYPRHRDTFVLAGAFLVFPEDVDADADDYWTVTVNAGSNEVCSRTTANGAEAGQAWEITRTGSAANRAVTSGSETVSVVFTASVSGTAPKLPSGIVVALVMHTGTNS